MEAATSMAARLGAACLLVLLGAAPADPPGGVSPGEPFPISDLPAAATVHGELDEEGRARLFAALAAPGKKKWAGVHYLQVDGETVVDRGVVLHRRRRREPSTSLAELGLGRWNAVLEDTRWGRGKPGGGAEKEPAPEFAFTADRAGLVRALLVGGESRQGPAAWEVGTPGGTPGGPWSHRVDKLAVIRQVYGTVEQFLFEPESGAPAGAARIAVDGSGAVHVLYERAERHDSLRYARIPLGDFRPVKFFESAWKSRPAPAAGLHGIAVGEDRPARAVDRIALAADPDSGTAMIAVLRSKPDAGRVFTRTIRDGRVGEAIPIGGVADGVLLAPAGDDRFHALIHDRAREREHADRILHLAWRDGRWSRPVLLGDGDAVSALLSDDSGRALAVWHDAGRLRGRWIALEG